jgi:predicted regulator of Ras-like GTPase activity (Roadblock/LC7/MglB family)
MFNTFKKFFGKRAEATLEAPVSPFRPATPAARPASTTPFNGQRAATPGRPPEPQSFQAPTNGGPTLALPLRAVIARLPDDLAKRVRQADVGEAELFLPLQIVLPQLVQGAVRISFGELRQSSPSGTFSAGNERDRMMVDLPLNEILARVNPGLLTRRPAQKQVVVPAEVTGPFGGQTQVVISPSAALRPVAPANAAPVNAAPAPAADEFTFKRVNAPISAPAALPVQAPITPIAASPAPVPVNPPAMIPVSPALRQMAAPASAPPTPVAPITPIAPIAPPAPVIPIASIVPTAPMVPFTPSFMAPPAAPVEVPEPEPEPIRFSPPPAPAIPAPAIPVPAAPPQPSYAGETRFLTASLADLSQAWPEALRQEIHQLNVPSAFVALPLSAVEATLKTGKVAFSWKLIRSWIKPPLAMATTSPHDLAIIELPLKIVTPLFMAELRTSRPQKKLVIDEAIPNLFSGDVTPEAAAAVPLAQSLPPAAVPTPAAPGIPPTDTNYYVWKDNNDTPDDTTIIIKKGPSPGTSFLQRYATPNEIVGKAAAQEGVGGALIALPDGLLVASKIPADMNADTLAAFLPAIFNRVSQSTKELRMGELNNLNFTVGHVPWKIFRVGAIYFAAFGISGQPLPTAHLANLAAELDRKPR